MTTTMAASVGDLLRAWRQRRRLSQLELAGDAEISTRHLSFIETGRSAASRAVLLRLAEQLEMPLRDRNRLLLAAGFASGYGEHALAAPEMGAARAAIDAILASHMPWPALAVDRYWTLVAANAAVAPLVAGVAETLLAPPLNVLRLSLHPQGLAPRIDNLGEWRAHLFERLRRQIAESGDRVLIDLLDELTAYPGRASAAPSRDFAGIAVPLKLRLPGVDRTLSFLSTTTVFGTPLDVTLSEIALECFFPADETTRDALRPSSA